MHKRLMLLLTMLFLTAGRAAGQIAWDAPYLVPPGSTPGFGIYLMDVHGGSLGVMGAWRSRTGSYGLRGGIAEARDDDIGAFGGVDFSGRVNRADASFPLDVDWVFGAGLGVADWVRVSIPLGLTLGHSFRGDGATFVPYITPRIFLDAAFDDDRDDDTETELGFALDLGLDLRFARTGFLVRFGASLGDRDAVAIGFVF